MNISNVFASTQAQNQQENPSTENKKLGKEGFLKLLVAQMQNQDPIDPMDGSELASQLAQFNSVEQLINLNDGIDKLAQSQNLMRKGLTNTMAASLAGKEVKAVSNKLNIQAGEERAISFRLSDAATNIEINIVDSAGNTVRTATLENLSGGEHSWSWDGKTGNGSNAPEGTYEVQISAYNEDSKVGVLTYQEGIAEKIRYTESGALLMLNGIGIPLADVVEIGV
ncbi:MAG TPA: flagellar hook capping FlgD N-terminal domain-containing protein [Balneolaceae bacterium]|nr:flagellar hook capping FlgD N-terminal domain-containing protein [Balneolaceae bacterium]